MNIAILSLQGAFAEHRNILNKLGINNFEIRQKSDLKRKFDGLILPGGESTVQGKLLRELGLFSPIKNQIEHGLPVFGTCSGMILLACAISNDNISHLGTMDITVKRNAYGRQLSSFYTEDDFNPIGKVPMTFIRAPYIEKHNPSVQILASVDGKAVAARQGSQLVTAFHPELNPDDTRVHEYFLSIIKNA